MRADALYNEVMVAANSLSSSDEKDLLRQREIEAQVAALSSPAPSARAAAARRLGDIQARADALLPLLDDPSEGVRAAAAMALGSFQGHERVEEIIDYLMSTIDDSSEKVCQSALRSLGMLQAEVARPEIESFLDDPNPYIAGAAILALARIGAEDLAPQLASFLESPSPYLQMQAARAVGILKYHPAGHTVARLLAQTRATRQAMGFSDPAARADHRDNDLYNLQNQLIRAAGELQWKEAVPTLLEIARQDIGFRGLAVEALIAIGADLDPALLAGLLSDPSIYLRKRLIQLITHYGYQPALPLLRDLLSEENVTVRGAALQAVTDLRDAEALDRVRWMGYHDANPFLRVLAVQGLAALGGAQELPHMASLAVDANYQVRRVACGFLLAWNAGDPIGLNALAAYLRDFPADPLAPEIQSFLAERNYQPQQTAPAEPAAPYLVPPEIEMAAPGLLDQLERWQAGLQHEPARPAQELRAALALVIASLRR